MTLNGLPPLSYTTVDCMSALMLYKDLMAHPQLHQTRNLVSYPTHLMRFKYDQYLVGYFQDFY